VRDQAREAQARRRAKVKAALETPSRLMGKPTPTPTAPPVGVDATRNRGGDLGWVPISHYPPAFANAVLQLKVGEYTHQPVQTPYGWHVIRLLEIRTLDAPPLESVRARLIANIKVERYKKFLDDSVHRVAVRLPTS